MKNFLFLLWFLSMTIVSRAQNTFPSSGNVGIGTTSPQYKLSIGSTGDKIGYFDDINHYGHIELYNGTNGGMYFRNQNASGGGYHFSASGTENLTILNNGNIGIGTTSPGSKLHVTGDILSGGVGSAGKIILARPSDGAVVGAIANENITGLRISTAGGSGSSYITFQTAAVTDAVRIMDNGNVGIGTTDTQGYKLAVNGNMIAESVKVKLHGSWPDYVFKNNYSLQTLSEIEKYILINKHLPGIPSEEQVKKEGLDIGEMNARLLQKIEELTLHLIEHSKRFDKLERLSEEQQKEINQLKSKL